MSVRRALVECAVLSLRDACVFYPLCKGCFSRIDVDQLDTTRCRCSRCGFSCLRGQLDYRYRLSLRVARDGSILGVTVFGTCLNPYFGIHASGLQRLVENSDGPVEGSTRSTLLLRAVEDCFIGRHFIFGIKISDTEGLWSGQPVNGSSSKDTLHFIATQMILPKASGLGGCTVVSYYQRLLQKAAEYEVGAINPGTSCRHPATTLLLVPHQSPPSNFSNGTLWASGLLPQSLQRSQHQDCTLTPTPPWQQSLGLVTSSAEQEEGCNTQDSEDEDSRQTDNFKAPRPAQRGCVEDCRVTEETMLSPPHLLQCSSYKYPLSIEKAVGNIPVLNTCFTPSPPGHNSSKQKGISVRKLTETFLQDSCAWEDMPFSESLTEFLGEENKSTNFDIVRKTKTHLNMQNQKEHNNFSDESTPDCQSNTQMADSHSQTLLDITDTHDVSDQVCKTPASSLCFENEDQEQLEGDTYDCSADLFSSSLMVDITNTVNTHAETIKTTVEVCPLLSKTNKSHLSCEKVSHSTPDKQKQKNNKCINRDSLSTQELDFIPPSQSTPIIKVAVVSGSHASTYRTMSISDGQDSCVLREHLLEQESKKPTAKITCACANHPCRCGKGSTKENLVWSTPFSSRSHRLARKRRFWKPNKHKKQLLAQQPLRIQSEALIKGSAGGINPKNYLSDCDVTVCEHDESNAVLVPPTPVVKTQLSVDIRRQRRTDDSSSNMDHNRKQQQGDGVHCKRTVLNQSLTSSQRSVAQTGSSDSETDDTVDEGNENVSKCNLDENETCDWSRDLFSDSV